MVRMWGGGERDGWGRAAVAGTGDRVAGGANSVWDVCRGSADRESAVRQRNAAGGRSQAEVCRTTGQGTGCGDGAGCGANRGVERAGRGEEASGFARSREAGGAAGRVHGDVG